MTNPFANSTPVDAGQRVGPRPVGYQPPTQAQSGNTSPFSTLDQRLAAFGQPGTQTQQPIGGYQPPSFDAIDPIGRAQQLAQHNQVGSQTSIPVPNPYSATNPTTPTGPGGYRLPNIGTNPLGDPNNPGAQQPGTTFGPGNNLIDQQFNPTQSGQLGQLGQQTQQAGQNVQNFQTGQFQGVPTSQYGQYTNQAQNLLGQAGNELNNAQIGQFGTIGSASDPRIQQLEQQQQFGIEGAGGNSQESQRLRQLTGQAAEGLAGAPNRQDIALQTLQNLDAEQADIRKLGIQDIGRAGARLGRLGSGMVTTSLGDLESQLNSQRERSLRDLSAQTASAEMGDRLASLSGLSGAGGQFRAEDLAGGGLGLQQSNAYGGLAGDIYGRGAGLRAEDRGERNFQYGAGSDAAQLALQRLGAGQGLSGQQFDQGSALRGEERGERADMTAQQQMQLQNLLAQQNAAQSQQGQQFGQEQINRNEYRTEREYQQALDQQNLQNQLGIQSQGFNQNLGISQLLADIGYGSGRYGNLSSSLVNTLQNQSNGTTGAAFDFAQGAASAADTDAINDGRLRVRDPLNPNAWIDDPNQRETGF